MSIERKPQSARIEQLLAQAGLRPGEKIQLDKLDAAMAAKGYTIAQRLKAKAELFREGLIAA